MNVFDTIAAVATPYGKGGVAMIRISGGEAIAIADRIFKAKSGKSLFDIESGRACYGDICSPLENQRSNDDGIAVIFRAPRSFTGEDTVEISCHGGILITQKVLSCALAAGARMAEAGEFTRRAYVSGKMRLNEAEALGNLLEAKNEGQLSLARNGMRGKLSARMEELYVLLRAVLTGIYANIDFPDEDLADMTRDEMLEALSEPAESIVMAVKAVLEKTPPELIGDISARGIVLTGGGALVYGMDRIIEEQTGIKTYVADDAESCVALGTGKALDNIHILQMFLLIFY